MQQPKNPFLVRVCTRMENRMFGHKKKKERDSQKRMNVTRNCPALWETIFFPSVQQTEKKRYTSQQKIDIHLIQFNSPTQSTRYG